MAQRKKERGFVYGIRVSGESPIKIGVTNSLKSRIDALQTGYYKQYIVVFAALVENPQAVELELHMAFSDMHINGEWFDISASDLTNEFGAAISRAAGKRAIVKTKSKYDKASDDAISKEIDIVVSGHVGIAKTKLIEFVNENLSGRASKTRIRTLLDNAINNGDKYNCFRGQYNTKTISKKMETDTQVGTDIR